MKPKNVIEINGKLYDAKSGAPLQTKKPAGKNEATLKSVPKNTRQTVKSIDGFSRHTTKKQTPGKAIAVKQHSPASKTVAKTKTPRNHPSGHSAQFKAKRSTTLNRSVVHAPTFAISTPIAATAPLEKADTLTSSALRVADTSRLSRAKHIAKSSTISRFGSHSATTSEKRPQVLTTHLVKTHANEATKSTLDSNKTKKSHLSTKEHLIKKAMDHAVITAPAASHKKNQSHKKSNRHSHRAGYTTTALAALLLAGYVAYLNVPSISMKVAAHRAGFAASMPGYKPAGYSLRGPIAYSPGQVTLNFGSNTDQRKFSLTQQPTTWDSTALLENYVTKKGANYLTYQDSGLTIYIMNSGSAAWVNGGKFYHVEGENSQLDTDQLLKLATSV